ncbi:uncharacterized protein LOC115797543 [Archocentrus centrarchus]|uniref:uncharacterized protein LOC115797543 n=1 Tax=Archocentrus centrarchus TaxID=63155 RepID=UPI0011E9BE52|nr:uncharacterized protein LOC115797543 [Archocentrus centrarchus]
MLRCQTDKMKLLLVFASIPLFICQSLGELIQTTVGEDVRFSLSEECKKGEGTLHQRLDDASTQLVASLNGVWKSERGYTRRVIARGDSLILKNADFNDSGHYEFTCNKKDLEAYKLEVFLPFEVVVTEGKDAILPCRSITAGQSVKSVRWRRSREVLLHLNAQSGEIIYGNGFGESRVSIPSDWHQRADLSLTIKQAQLKDEGVYYCDMEKMRRHRSAVRLQVRKPPPSESSSHWVWTTILITAAVTSGISGPLAFYLGRKAKPTHA